MRRGILPVAMASVAVTAAACGTTQGDTHNDSAGGSGGRSAQSPVQIVTAAYTRTTSTKTAKVTLREQIAAHLSGGTDQQTTVTGQGIVDFAHHSADLTASTAHGALEVRTLNGSLYLKLPVSERRTVGTAWVKVDLNKVAKAKTGASLSQLTGAAPTDPRQQLAYLRGVSDQVKRVGTATVGGVRTTHYQATVDLDTAAAKDGAAAQHAITRVEQQLGRHTLPVDAWIDSQGRLRRLSFVEHIRHLASAGGSASGSATIKITETLSDFGVKAAIKAPPAGQTTDVTGKVLAATG